MAQGIALRTGARQTPRSKPEWYMRVSMRLTLAFAAISVPLLAIAAASLPESIAGVYKTRFKNGLVTGETYQSEDVLEIVPTGRDAAYVRAHLDFYNGHQCGIYGIAHLAGRELVYREPAAKKIGDRQCVLHLGARGDKVVLSDEGGSCEAYCGARGSLSNDSFPISTRRTIRYMARLKASQEYKAALAEDAANGPPGPAGPPPHRR